jgi:hypothetical protein
MGEILAILVTVALLSRFDLVIYAVARVFGNVK